MIDSSRAPESIDPERRLDAVAEDYLARLQAGERPDMAAVVAAHPDIAEPLQRRLALVERLFRAGQNAKAAGGEGHPLPADQAHRLKCPHCGNGIQLVEPRQKEITCLNCGSSFLVDPESTVTYKSARPGSTIGRFQILELLGRGAFGEVYKARDSELDRFVAVKIPRNDYFATSEEAQRFLREARSAAGLRHPGIVQVHEIAHEQDAPYIVSDYIEGLTLADLITGGRPAFREAAELVALLADALDYAHRQKVIHRDIKPSNILLGTTNLPPLGPGGQAGSRSADGRPTSGSTPFVPYLADFGLARRDEGEITVTLDGQVLGTPAYMSPEQAAGDHARVDGRSDVYSLGVVLYELLSGELPFRGSRRMLLHQVLHDEPRAPHTLNDQIPRDLETICLKAMAKEPARRYRTAAEFADDLRRFLRGDPITARRVGPIERTWRWCRRNPLLAGLCAAVAASLLIGTVVSTYFAARSTAKADDATRESARADRKADEAVTEALRANANADESRRNLYISDMRLAEQEWEAGRVASSIALLERHQPRNGDEDLRGWEWFYQQRLCRQELRTFVGHGEDAFEGFPAGAGGAFITSVTFSLDGRLLATNGRYGVKIWDVGLGRELWAMRGHARNTERVAFSPDGRILATAGADETESAIKLWDLASGKEQSRVGTGARVTCDMAFSEDGLTIVTVDQFGTVDTWDRASLKVVRSFGIAAQRSDLGPRVRASLAQGAGQLIVVPYYDTPTISFWDVNTKTQVCRLSQTFEPVSCYAVSSDTRRLATCSFGRLRVLDLDGGNGDQSLADPPGDITCMAYSPNGERLAIGCDDGTIRFRDAATGRNLRRYSGHAAGITCLAFSFDGSQFASGDDTGAIKLWDVSAMSARPVSARMSELIRVASTPDWLDRNWSVNASPHAKRVQEQRDVSEGLETRVLACRNSGLGKIAFSHDGASVASLSGSEQFQGQRSAYRELIIWNLRQPIYRPVAKTLVGDVWLSQAFRPDGTCVALKAGTHAASIVDADTGAERSLNVWNANCKTGVLSHDGTHVAVARADGAILVLDTSSLETIWQVDHVPLDPNRQIRICSDRGMIACQVGAKLWIWNIGTTESLNKISHNAYDCREISISADGRWVAAATEDGVMVWSILDGKLLHTLVAHPEGGLHGSRDEVCAVAFSPDGSRLVTAGGIDRTAKLWDFASGQLLRTLRGHVGDVNCATFNPSGDQIATASEDTTIRIFDARPLSEELSVEREARAITEFLAMASTSETNLVDRIQTRLAITEQVRQHALSFASGQWRAEVSARAADIVNSIRDELLLKSLVIDRLKNDATINGEIRDEAVRITEQFEESAQELNAASWKITSRPGTDPSNFRRALIWAEAACRLSPDDGNHLNTLGVAQYRVGDLDVALATLARSFELNKLSSGKPHPVDVAFLSLVHHELGHAEEAKALLQELTELSRQEQWRNDFEIQAFLREAEEKIGKPPLNPGEPM